MQAKKETLENVVTELVAPDAVPLVMYLRGKKRISEFIIAEELELEIHKTRFLLYKLLEHNIVSFIRKKDKIKGWYICYWDLNESMIGYLEKKIKKDKVKKLKIRLNREQHNDFFLCKNACARMDFDQAIESHFKCPECGEIMHHQDNSRTIEFLKNRIEELENENQEEKRTEAQS